MLKRLDARETGLIHNQEDWLEEYGIIRFSVESFGSSRDQFLECFRRNGFKIAPWTTEKILRSFCFEPTDGVKKEIVIFKTRLFGGNDVDSKEVVKMADNFGRLMSPGIETSFLILEKFSIRKKIDEDLSWIVVGNNPLENTFIGLEIDSNCRQLIAVHDYPDRIWPNNGGFAFEDISISSKT